MNLPLRWEYETLYCGKERFADLYGSDDEGWWWENCEELAGKAFPTPDEAMADGLRYWRDFLTRALDGYAIVPVAERERTAALEGELATAREDYARAANGLEVAQQVIENGKAELADTNKKHERLKEVITAHLEKCTGGPCACQIDENDNIIVWCGLHQELMDDAKAELADLREGVRGLIHKSHMTTTGLEMLIREKAND